MDKIENDIRDINATVKGTFSFPRLPNNRGSFSPFTKYDTDIAEELIQRWTINTEKVVGPIVFYAIPEVREKDRRTRTPLHYHAFFAPENPTRFMEVAPRKWENLLRHKFPKIKSGSLWMEEFDPKLPESHEYYCLKNTLADWGWGRTHILTNTIVRPDYMNAI
jgi:hypothetical protein